MRGISAPEEVAIDLAYVDAAIRFRQHHLPEGRYLDRAREQLVHLAGDRWPDAQKLGHAIRCGEWWPAPAGYRTYPPGADRSIPEEYRRTLPP